MIDTHTHLYLPEFSDDGAVHDGGKQAVCRAFDAGVSRLVFPNVGLDTIAPMKELAARHPGRIAMAMGLHPTEVRESWQPDLDAVLRELDNGLYVAVGEVGIDLYWDKTFLREQQEVFSRQLLAAKQHRLPVIIHCREGLGETLSCIRETGAASEVPLVFHSFTGTADDVRRIRAVVPDALFGINGVCTFRNAASVREALPEISLGRMLLETDSPYLAPVPRRGRRNESAFLPYIAAQIAQTLGVSSDEVIEATDRNAAALFFPDAPPPPIK